MSFNRSIYLVVVAALLLLVQTACKKEKLLITGGKLEYSTDTLQFDTVFTAKASFTTQVKLYNREKRPVKLSSVRMEKGPKSYFHINVNGFEGNLVNDVEIAANDSIYVFATVNIDPTDENTPFLITDNLVATLNGNEFKLPFEAYGQNAHYIIDSVLETQTWLTDKPYVIIHNALVDSGHTLTIPAGCRIYVNADSRLFVAGVLRAIGTKTDSIVFQGGRLDRKYFGDEGYPGEWGGLYFTGQMAGSVLDYVTLKNCGNSTTLGNNFLQPAAIQVNYNESGGLTLEMHHTVVENSIGHSLLSFSGTVYADNCLFNTAGAHNLYVAQGGIYNFVNCTFATYGTDKVSHIDNPSVVLANYIDLGGGNIAAGNLICSLTNCVVDGSLESEIAFVRAVDVPYDVTLANCLVKTKDGIPEYVKQKDCQVNVEPQFKDRNAWDFVPAEGSPLIDKGMAIPGLTDDLEGNPRTGLPDIGCYEAP